MAEDHQSYGFKIRKKLIKEIENVLLHHNAIRKGLNKKIFEIDNKNELLRIARILKFAQPVWLKLSQFNNDRKNII